MKQESIEIAILDLILILFEKKKKEEYINSPYFK